MEKERLVAGWEKWVGDTEMSMEKVKVCCFCEKWESGGIESFLSNVIGRLEPEEFQVDIVAANLSQSVFTKQLQRRGVRFFQLSGNQRRLMVNQRKFLELLRRERYHVVHLNLFQGLSLAYVGTAKRAGIPVRIAHSHNTALRKSATKPLKELIHNAAKYIFAGDATEFWACSSKAARFLFPKRALEKRGYRFIPNGIEVERFRFDPSVRNQVRAELGLEDKLVIGNVGRLCYQKNQDFLLDVFAQVKRRRLESRLLLVGEGELLEQLKEKARRLNVADCVIFYGVSAHVERLLWAMDVFAFPSRFEGLGIAVVEAQAAGLPVIVSECVPEEAYVTPALHKVLLEAGPKQWADALIGAYPDGGRGAYGNGLKCMGFDISCVIRQIEASFLNKKVEQQRK